MRGHQVAAGTAGMVAVLQQAGGDPDRLRAHVRAVAVHGVEQ